MATDIPSAIKPDNELHIRVEHIRKKYSDDNGRFPVCSRSENKYIMIVYNCESNTSIAANFKSSDDRQWLIAYNSIKQQLKDCSMLVDLQILDNEASA